MQEHDRLSLFEKWRNLDSLFVHSSRSKINQCQTIKDLPYIKLTRDCYQRQGLSPEIIQKSDATENENGDVDHAIVLSLAEENQKVNGYITYIGYG
ncbi:unnamed protein product [Vicia faba]|uniref:Uncharacterized protein n=1 Tax=Vicia faba TaxID=3906 RepID=A0AAV1A4A7_VICFA|nr:unnamed protein product [Vicia faba]